MTNTDLTDDFLGGSVRMIRLDGGYKATSDAVLLAAVVQARKNEKILDAGVGTGAVSLCLNARIRGLHFYGIDIQPQMIDLFKKNILLNHTAENFHSFTGNICDKNNGLPHGFFDCVVTNPPFIQENCISPNSVKDTAHRQNNISLTEWIDACLKYLKPKGRFYMINRADRLPEILSVLFNRLGDIHVIPVYTKEGSPAKRIIVHAKNGSKTPATLENGIILNDKNGKKTVTAENIMRLGHSL